MAAVNLSHDRITPWLFSLLPGQMGRWLPGQRWFGAKSRSVASVAVEELVWLPAAHGPVALVVMEVSYEADASGRAAPDRYALVVGVSRNGRGAIAPVAGAPELFLTEMATEPDAVRALLAGLADGRPAYGVRGGVVRFGDATRASRALVTSAPPPVVTPVGAEQSNTSVRVGAAHVFKLFRRLEEGRHPQLEVGRFLAAAGFTGAPPLEGSLEYEPAGGDACALGALEGWIPNEGDGWSYLVTRLASESPAAETLSRPLADTLARLGAVTADFHAALAGNPSDAAFAPVPVTAAHAARWQEQAARQAERAIALLAAPQPSWPPELTLLAARVLGGGPHPSPVAPQTSPDDTFVTIRIHGDFHLGQTLRTADGFVIIDFEGEPTRPLDERRQRHCALKDVAGMLRSFDYAAASTAVAADPAVRLRLSSRMRAAFLEAYMARSDHHDARFLPATARARAEWTSFFELQKVLYEIEYELHNRPGWAPLPLAALERFLRRA